MFSIIIIVCMLASFSWGNVSALQYHLLTYATSTRHITAAQRLTRSALDVGGFDTAQVYSHDVLDESYRFRNMHILSLPRGAGYWVYKPYVVLRYMHEKADLNDVVCYMDSMYEFKQPFTHQVDLWLAASRVPVALTTNKPDEPTYPEKRFSKSDAFFLMGVNESVFGESLQAWCGFICFKNTFEAVQYVAAWLTYTQDARIVTDAPSRFGTESKDFLDNRHDQTVCSLLAKAYNVTLHHFPSGPVHNHHILGT